MANTKANIISIENGTEIKVLVNPFSENEKVKILKGSIFTSTHPSVVGAQETKRGYEASIHHSNVAVFDPYFDIDRKFSGDETLYKTDRNGILVKSPSITCAGSGGYWKRIALSEEMIRLNGYEPEYKAVAKIDDNGFFKFIKS